MSQRQLLRYAIYAAVAVIGYRVLTGAGILGPSIRNLGGVPIGGTANIGGRGGL